MSPNSGEDADREKPVPGYPAELSPRGVAQKKHPKTISGELSETPLRRERLNTCPRAHGSSKVGGISVQWERPATLGFPYSLPNLSHLQKSIAQLMPGSGVGRDMQPCLSDHGTEYAEGVSYVVCGADWT